MHPIRSESASYGPYEYDDVANIWMAFVLTKY